MSIIFLKTILKKFNKDTVLHSFPDSFESQKKVSLGVVNVQIHDQMISFLSSSPRGFSVVLRFIVKSIPIAVAPKYPLSLRTISSLKDKSTWLSSSDAVDISISRIRL